MDRIAERDQACLGDVGTAVADDLFCDQVTLTVSPEVPQDPQINLNCP